MVDPILWTSPFNPLIGSLVGFALLFAGRRLFWLLVGAVGFAFGFQLAQSWLGIQEPWLHLVIALALGLVAAFLAVLLQRVAISLAGFLIGGTAAGWAAEVFLDFGSGAAWVVYLVGGIVAALLAGILFDLALIVLSSLLGASLVLQAALTWGGLDRLGLDGSAATQTVAFLVLTGIGLAAQALQPRREQDRERDRERRLHRQEERRRS